MLAPDDNEMKIKFETRSSKNLLNINSILKNL